jgi:hypothetical protein
MVIVGKAVLAFGILSVFGAAVHNNHRAQASDASAAIVRTAAATAAVAGARHELPRGYWTNPATSPLVGANPRTLPPTGPILRSDARPVVPTTATVASSGIEGMGALLN